MRRPATEVLAGECRAAKEYDCLPRLMVLWGGFKLRARSGLGNVLRMNTSSRPVSGSTASFLAAMIGILGLLATLPVGFVTGESSYWNHQGRTGSAAIAALTGLRLFLADEWRWPLMEIMGGAPVRTFVLSGAGFDRPGDSMAVGLPSAEILFRDGPDAEVVLWPARAADAPGTGRRWRAEFHKPVATMLLSPGAALRDEAGGSHSVVDRDAETCSSRHRLERPCPERANSPP